MCRNFYIWDLCRRKVVSGRRSVGAIRFLVVRGLQLKAARVLHESLFMLALIHGSEKILWKE